MNVDDAMETAAAYLAHEQEGEPLFCAEEVAITLAAEVERLRAELAEAKAASVPPVEVKSVYVGVLQLATRTNEEKERGMSNNEQDGEQIAIRGMSHFYGDLWILKDGDDYFWLLDDYNGGDWKPITKQLYEALLDHNRRVDTPPQA